MPDTVVAQALETTLQNYRQQKWTGFVTVSSHNQQPWQLYFVLGRIVWIASRRHSLRRWCRQLARYSPSFFAQVKQPLSRSYPTWNYSALARLVKIKQFSHSQFSQIVEGCIREDLFDMLQAGSREHYRSGQLLSFEEHSADSIVTTFILPQASLVCQEVLQSWQDWQAADLSQYSPDVSVKVVSPDGLKEKVPPLMLQAISVAAQQHHSLWDMSLLLKLPVLELTTSLLPLVEQGLLAFTEMPNLIAEQMDHGFPTDLAPLSAAAVQAVALPDKAMAISHSAPSRQSGKAQRNGGRIAYIDHQQAAGRTMATILEGVGFQCTHVANSLQAVPALIELKPTLVLLELEMPMANGYEVCAQIRRIRDLEDVPVVMVTSSSGLLNRVKAKVAGASDFISKPVQKKAVLKILEKHIPQFKRPDL